MLCLHCCDGESKLRNKRNESEKEDHWRKVQTTFMMDHHAVQTANQALVVDLVDTAKYVHLSIRGSNDDDDDDDDDNDDDDDDNDGERDSEGDPLEGVNISKWKVAELKAELTERGLAIAGKKADLVARLTEDVAPHAAPEPAADEGDGDGGNEVHSVACASCKWLFGVWDIVDSDGTNGRLSLGLTAGAGRDEDEDGDEGEGGAASPSHQVSGYVWFNEAHAATPIGWMTRWQPAPPGVPTTVEDAVDDFVIADAQRAAPNCCIGAHSGSVELAVQVGTPYPFCYGRYCNDGSSGTLSLTQVTRSGVTLLKGELMVNETKLPDHYFTAYQHGTAATAGDCLHDHARVQAEREQLAADDKLVRAGRRRRMEELGRALDDGESGDSEIDYLDDDDDDIVPPW